MQSHSHIRVIFGLLFFSAFNYISASQISIITTKAYITNLCESNCQQSTEKPFIRHCERGCRFFYLAQTTNLREFNITSSTSLCVDSCNEAYADEKNQATCILGCNKAKEEILHLEERANVLMEEAEKEMNVFNLIFSKIASSFWSPDGSEESDEIIGDHLRVRPFHLFNDALANINRMDHNINNDVKISTQNRVTTSIDSPGVCVTCIWLHRLFFILIVMGILSILLISSIFIATFIRNKKVNNTVGDLSKPPSYETLINDGIIVSKEMVTSRQEDTVH